MSDSAGESRNSFLFDGRRVTIPDLVDAGLVLAGDKLTFSQRNGDTHWGTITSDGELQIEGGRTFTSPSPAAMRAADMGPVDGWHIWRLDRTNDTLHELRLQLLRAEGEVSDAAPEDRFGSRQPVSRHGYLEDARDRAAAADPVTLTVRELLSWYRARGRGRLVKDKISADLDNYGLRSIPDFRKVALDSTIQLSLVRVEEPEPRLLESPAVVAPEVEELDVGLTLGNIESALGGVVSVAPGDTLEKAVTLMRVHDFSQLPVLSGERNVRGAVTWRSIGKAKVADGAAELEDAIEPASDLPYTTELIDVLDLLVAHDFVLVRDDQNRIAGIVTTADVAALYGQMATPFFLIGELDQLLRAVISTVIPLVRVQALCDPDETGRISDFDDMTFGDYLRVLQNPAEWGRLDWHLDRAIFTTVLDEIRELRNAVAHFNPDPIELAEVAKLRHMLILVRELRAHVG